MGAWIEITLGIDDEEMAQVAPLVGAWIEIQWGLLCYLLSRSRPSWARGLKYMDAHDTAPEMMVAPLVGAWIEIKWRYQCIQVETVAPLVGAWIEMRVKPLSGLIPQSRPSWARGLKYTQQQFPYCFPWSRPSWARGLKFLAAPGYSHWYCVAPLVGAWIEIPLNNHLSFI